MRAGYFTTVGKVIGVAYAVAIVFILAFLVGQVLSAKNNVVYYYSGLRAVNEFSYEVNGENRGIITLPTTIEGLKPFDQVTLKTQIESMPLDNLLVKTVNVPLSIYVNNKLYDTRGTAGTYPAFQKEPPIEVDTIALPEDTDALELRFEYSLSQLANHLELPQVLAGDKSLLFMNLVEHNAVSFFLSLLILLTGISLVVVGLAIMRKVQVGSSLIWLGLSCLATGAWTFCGNDVALFFIPSASLMYNLSYIGICILAIPFIRFGLIMLNPLHKMPLEVFHSLVRAAFLVLLILHLSGVFAFAQSAPYIEICAPVALVAFIIWVVIEHVRYANPLAIQFGISCAILAVFTLLELANSFTHVIAINNLLFQIGVVFFIFELSILAWRYVSDGLDAAEKNARLEVEIAATNRNLDLQRTLYETLTKSNEEVRVLRHDLRHQLTALKGYLAQGEEEAAIQYIDKLSGNIPTVADKLLCDNFAVNALAVHYLGIAQADKTQVDLRLVVPHEAGRIPDNDLCVVIGNLFENAIEACRYVDENKRFIKLQTMVAGNRLTVVMDNSFDGHIRVRNGAFYSRKRTGKGIGMASVLAEVEKYDGAMKYETENEVFKTSLYVKM
ncbi:MAG: GHKL domain-containing protein [Coriobacteriales bacterium]|jgi:hypothetical protein|nr:GHKL domain-containing protein [Coriobacteriales bacterium]